MKKVYLLPVVFLLSACIGGARNASPPVVYDFGLPAARLVADGSWSALALEVRSPSWFNSLNVDYRLTYDDALKQREYASARWAGPPDVLVAQALRQQLGAVSATGNTAAGCLLRVELQEFSQVFDSPQASRGVLQGSASIINSKRQQVVQRPVSIDKPAPSADARGGVSALAAASAELGQQLADWLGGPENRQLVGECRRP